MPRKSIWNKKFNWDRDFVVARQFLCNGKWLVPGEPFDKESVARRRLRLFHEMRLVEMVDEGEVPINLEPVVPYEVKHVAGGRYAVMRGTQRISSQLKSKDEAEAELAQLTQ